MSALKGKENYKDAIVVAVESILLFRTVSSDDQLHIFIHCLKILPDVQGAVLTLTKSLLNY